MQKLKLTTDFRTKKLARDEAIFKEYELLMSQPQAMSTMVADHIMNKYEICSRSTVWQIVKRVRAKKDFDFAKGVLDKKLNITDATLAKRDDEILQEFQAKSTDKRVENTAIYRELMAKHKLSRPALFQAIKRARLRNDPDFRSQHLNEISNGG